MKTPSTATLKKYGLNAAQWNALPHQACAICDRPFIKLKGFIDHEHVKGFSKMPAAEKRRYVRGVLCYWCNRFRVAKNNYSSIMAIKGYLEKYHGRQNSRA
jgi:hypothetical protein